MGCNVAEIAQLPRWPLFKTLPSVSGSCAFCAQGFSDMLSASVSYSGGGLEGFNGLIKDSLTGVITAAEIVLRCLSSPL